jgi:serine/threonine protein kinase
MTDVPARAGFYLRRPSIVSEIINTGRYGRLALLRTDPTSILKFCSDNPAAISSLEQEKRIYAILGHHKFITNLRWVSDKGLCFEYYPLGSLRSYYQSQLPPLNRRLLWCHQLAEGVAFIHSKNIVHNDLTAANTLVSSSLDIKICDFGFATLVDEEQTGGTETRYCRVSESHQGKACILDDLFSVGSLFYEILSCSGPPYKDRSSSEVLRRFGKHDFPSLENIRPEPYATIIHNCWSEQYQSISDLQTDLPPYFELDTSEKIENKMG